MPPILALLLRPSPETRARVDTRDVQAPYLPYRGQ